MIVEYTEQEGNELLQLIDIAVKNQGLAIAEMSLRHAAKLKVAFDKEQAKSNDKQIKQKD